MSSFKKYLNEQVLNENARYDSDVRERFIPFAWNTFMEFMLSNTDKKLSVELIQSEIIPQLLSLINPSEENPVTVKYSPSVTNEVEMLNNFKKKSEIVDGLNDINASSTFLFKLFSTLMSNFSVSTFDKKTVAKLRMNFVGRGDSKESVGYSESFKAIIEKIKHEQQEKNADLDKTKNDTSLQVGRVDVSEQRKIAPKSNFTAYDSKAQIAFHQPEQGSTIFTSGKVFSKSVATLALNNISKNSTEIQDKIFKQIEQTLHKELSDFTQLNMSDAKATNIKKTRETGTEDEKAQIEEMDRIHTRISDSLNTLFANDKSVTKTLRNEFIRLSLTGENFFNDKKYEANTMMATLKTGETAIALIDETLVEHISQITDIKVTYKNGATALYFAMGAIKKKDIKAGKSEIGVVGDVSAKNANTAFGEETLTSFLTKELKVLKEEIQLTESIVADTKELFNTLKNKVKNVIDKLLKKAKELLHKGIIAFLNFFGVIIDNVMVNGFEKVEKALFMNLSTGTKPKF